MAVDKFYKKPYVAGGALLALASALVAGGGVMLSQISHESGTVEAIASSARTYVLRRTDGSTNKPFLYKEREPLKVGTTSNLRFLKSTPSVWTPAADVMLYFAVILISLGAVLIILAILVITKRIKLWV
jgi:hypothetical protein